MLPYVVLHNAVSVDGRITGFPVDLGLYYGLISRWSENATLVGSGTILNPYEEIPAEEESDFEPSTTDPDDPRPLLVVPDSKGRIRTWHFWRKQNYWRDLLVLCAKTTAPTYLDYLKQRHIKYMIAGGEHVDLRAALEALRDRHGVEVVRVDSGGTLNGVLLRQGLVDEVSLLVHPSLVGGTSPHSFFRSPDLDASEDAIPLQLTHVEALQDGIVWLRYRANK